MPIARRIVCLIWLCKRVRAVCACVRDEDDDDDDDDRDDAPPTHQAVAWPTAFDLSCPPGGECSKEGCKQAVLIAFIERYHGDGTLKPVAAGQVRGRPALVQHTCGRRTEVRPPSTESGLQLDAISRRQWLLWPMCVPPACRHRTG